MWPVQWQDATRHTFSPWICTVSSSGLPRTVGFGHGWWGPNCWTKKSCTSGYLFDMGESKKHTVSVSMLYICYIVMHKYVYIYISMYICTEMQRNMTLWHEIWVRTWDSPYQLGSWISSIKHILQNDPRIMNPLLVLCVNQRISMRLMCLYSSFLLFLLYIGFVWEKVTASSKRWWITNMQDVRLSHSTSI